MLADRNPIARRTRSARAGRPPETGRRPPVKYLIKVAAAGVNRPDVLQRQGRYPPPPGASDIPGLEVAGTSRRSAPAVHRVARRRSRLRARRRRRIRGVLRGAGAAVPAVAARHWISRPRRRFPETFFTVWTNVFERGRLQPASRCWCTAARAASARRRSSWRARAARACSRRPGSPEKCARLRAARRGARPSTTATRTSSPSSRADRRARRRRRARHGRRRLLRATSRCWRSTAGSCRSRTLGGAKSEINIAADPAAPADHHRFDAAPAVDRGERRDRAGACDSRCGRSSSRARCAPIVHATFPLRDAAEAHRLMESSAHIGKLVLQYNR